jgi:hypothetical protein
MAASGGATVKSANTNKLAAAAYTGRIEPVTLGELAKRHLNADIHRPPDRAWSQTGDTGDNGAG